MIYLLDTNTCIAYINGRSIAIRERLDSLSPDDVAICDVVKYELYYGAYKSAKQRGNLASLSEFWKDLVSLPFDGQAADICGYIRAQLASRGTPIGAYDLQIAAICLANNLILVTHNVDEFRRVEELRIED